MKKIYAVLTALVMSGSLFAQDMAVNGITPDEFTVLKNNTVQSFQVAIEAAEAIPAQSTLQSYYAWDSDNLQTLGDQLTFNQNVSQGTELNINANIMVEGNNGDTATLVFAVKTSGDNNAMNDTIRIQYIIQDTVAKDLELTIISPADGEQVKNWSQVPFEFQFKNVGSETLADDDVLIQRIFINNQPASQPSGIQNPVGELAPGDSSTFTSNVGLPKEISPGQYQFCFSIIRGVQSGQTISPDEDYTRNNVACVTLNVIANNIDETYAELGNVSYHNGHLMIDFTNKMTSTDYELRLYDVAGKLVETRNFNPGYQTSTTHRLPIPRLNDGIYMLEFNADGRTVGMEKLYVR